jgi:hypothetical protein
MKAVCVVVEFYLPPALRVFRSFHSFAVFLPSAKMRLAGEKMCPVNIVKRIKSDGRWKILSIPRNFKGNYA